MFLPYANNKSADQPVHSSAFIVRFLDSIIPTHVHVASPNNHKMEFYAVYCFQHVCVSEIPSTFNDFAL